MYSHSVVLSTLVLIQVGVHRINLVYNYHSVAELQLVSFFCDQGHGHLFALQTAGVLPSRGVADISHLSRDFHL